MIIRFFFFGFLLPLLLSSSLIGQTNGFSLEEFNTRNENFFSKIDQYIESDSAQSKLYLDSISLSFPSLKDTAFRALLDRKLNYFYDHFSEKALIEELKIGIDLTRKRGDSLYTAILCDQLSEVYLNNSSLSLAYAYAQKALIIHESLNRLEDKGKTLLRIAAIKYSQGDYISSIEAAFEAIDKFKEVGSDKHLAFSYIQVGTTYLFIKQFESARKNFEIAKEQFLKQNDTLGFAMCEANIALIHLESEDYNTAIERFKEANRIILKSNRKIAISQIYQNIGTCFLGINQFDSAYYYFKKTIAIDKEIEYTLGLSTSYLEIARLKEKKGEIDSSIYYAKKSLALGSQTDDVETKSNILALIGKLLYEKKKETESAFYLYNYYLLQDSIMAESDLIQQFAIEQDAKIKSYKEQLLIEKQKKELIESENKYQKKLILILSIIGVFMIAMIVIVSMINQKNQRLNTELRENQDIIKNDLAIKNSLLKEIHHRVKNNLQVISSMLSIQSQYINNPKFQEIINECKSRINSMALIHESLYRKDPNDITSFSAYLKNLIPQLIATYQVDESKIILKLEIEDINLSIDESVPCGLLINEIVSNALKHAFPNERDGEIFIQLNKKEDMIFLNIKDNGIGLPEDIDPKNHDSFGFLLIYTLVSQLDADLEVNREGGLEFCINWNTSEYQMLD